MRLPSIETRMSPSRPPRMGRTPATSAGPPGTTFMTIMPLSCSSSAMMSGAKTMPRTGRRTKPLAMMLSTFFATVSMGMARPTPAKPPLPLRMAVLTPMTWPSELSKGPPLLPGLIEASVWMTPLMGLPPMPSIFRARPLMIPRLRLCSRPKGLPKAKTFCPTNSFEEAPRGNGCMIESKGVASASVLPPAAGAALARSPTRSTATSLAESAPTTTASSVVRRSRPVFGSFLRKVTNGLSEPATTWAFVTMCCLSHTKPLPAMLGARSSLQPTCGASLEIDTTPGVTRSKRLVTCDSSVLRPSAGGAARSAKLRRLAANSTGLLAASPPLGGARCCCALRPARRGGPALLAPAAAALRWAGSSAYPGPA
mmetsp:Transcript_57254/g.153281  ORF Transcript_57254/g.153281 Transcript_57254/m.153281 type:complete len:369 (+) Transcript_57254:196-1302(+)